MSWRCLGGACFARLEHGGVRHRKIGISGVEVIRLGTDLVTARARVRARARARIRARVRVELVLGLGADRARARAAPHELDERLHRHSVPKDLLGVGLGLGLGLGVRG